VPSIERLKNPVHGRGHDVRNDTMMPLITDFNSLGESFLVLYVFKK